MQTQKRPEPVGAFSFLPEGLAFAVTRQQGRLFTARAAWQLVEQFGGRETVNLGLFVHDLRTRLAIARSANGGFLASWLIFTRRAAVAWLILATALAGARTTAFFA